MKYVAIRDDDTNALTPLEYLEDLYRPFLERNLPINLAVIPNVRTDITYGDGIPEGFLAAKRPPVPLNLAISSNAALVNYLRENPGYHIAQHGCTHEFVAGGCEFQLASREEAVQRLESGARLLMEAGFPKPCAFVAPYDRFSRVTMDETARRFPVISTGWFEWGALPLRWWPKYLWTKCRRKPHWKAGNTVLLSHPPCYLSYRRPYSSILKEIRKSIGSSQLTVLVTHWWEFFRNNQPDTAFIRVLHDTAEFLAGAGDLQVISFQDIADGKAPWEEK
jgi:hypothetical protein